MLDISTLSTEVGARVYLPVAVILVANGTPRLSVEVGASNVMLGGVEYFLVVSGTTLMSDILDKLGLAATLANADW